MVSFADFTDMVIGYTPVLVDMEQLLRNADDTLFCKALKDVYCLHHLLPELKTLPIQLRPANHNYHRPICKYELYKRSFIVRSLFNFNYQ